MSVLQLRKHSIRKFAIFLNNNVISESEISIEYANILADVTLGKNLLTHYQAVGKKIKNLNRSIDFKTLHNEDCNWVIAVCYQYYRLQGQILEEFKTNGFVPTRV